jgi:NAD(P)-dependent dehydrogenase (short-subunit alcohol dehydrogenase family)
MLKISMISRAQRPNRASPHLMDNKMILKDKVIIVTGVGPGMGRSLALLLAQQGAKVVIAARSNRFLSDVAADIRETGGEAEAVPTDVADPTSCSSLATAAIKAFGRIDGLVNSAYITYREPIAEIDLSKWRQVLDVNCFGAVQMAQAVIPHMRAGGGGSIVNVGTMAVRKPLLGRAAYASSKAALGAVTRQLALELGQHKIRANIVWIGWMWGAPIQQYVKNAAQTRGVPEQVLIDEITKDIPLGAIPTDEECAKTILFFLSDYASAVTGASLDVNGGEYMPA